MIFSISNEQVCIAVRCLRFKYSMYGRGMGTLNIYHYDPSSSDKDIGPPIWTRSGDQGEGWHNAEVDTAKAGYVIAYDYSVYLSLVT